MKDDLRFLLFFVNTKFQVTILALLSLQYETSTTTKSFNAES